MSRIKKKQSEEISLIKNWIEHLSESEFRDAITFTFEKDDNAKSHEYELLKQMVDLQSPPPTPIHPRAMGVKLASNVFSSDGRDEEERIMRNRRVRPRLYQFIERKNSNGFDLDQSLASLPPEIAAMVRKENTVQSSSKQKRNRGENTLSYDVIARQFRASWGEQLSLAPTEEMRIIDEELLFGTYLKGGGEQSRCCTFKRCNYREHQDEKAYFLKVLKIASRGRFLSEEPQRKSCKFMAPWLQPTKEWFSLSTYLASRFEIALWNSFRFHRCNGFVKTVTVDSIEASLRQLNVSQSSSAVAGVMKQLLEVSIADGKLRDELVYKLLTRPPDVRTTRDLEEIQLVRLNTTIDTFRIMLMNHLKSEITKLAERDLLQSHPNQRAVGNSGNRNVKGKKRRKKKKRRNKPIEMKLVAIDEKRGDDANSTSNSSRSSNNVGLTLPPTITLNEEDNQHKIVALGILDDIMEGVWKKVGLQGKVQEEDGFQPTRMKVNAQKRQKEAYILKKRIKKKPEVLQKTENTPNSSDFIEDNMMTMKRSNLSPSLSIWNSNSRPPLFQASGGSKGLTNLFTPLETIDDRVESNFLTSNQGDQGFLHGGSYEYGDQNFSFFSDFFDNGKVDRDFASSTAASIASSILDNDEDEEVIPMEDDFFFRVPTPTEALDSKLWPEADIVEVKEQEVETELQVDVQETSGNEYDPDDSKIIPSMSDLEDEAREVKTPPVVVSLADLGELRRKKSSRHTFSDIEEETIDEGNEMPPENLSLPKQFSREDLRSIDVPPRRKNALCSSRTVDFSSLTYRNVAVKKSDKARSVSSHDVPHHYSKRPSLRRIKSFTRDMKEVIIDRGNFNLNACARSETALDDNEESSHWNVIPKNVVENDNNSVTKDGATTISSIPTYHEIDEIHNLRSERDSYRDICLTMAAEISKLKNMLALERINSNYSIPQNVHPFGIGYMNMPSFVHEQTEQGATKRYVAMSDAGLNEVPVSEDGNITETATVDVEKKRMQRANSFGVHHNFISGGSDIISLGNTTYSAVIPPEAIYPHKLAEKGNFNGLQSRLSDEVNLFLTKTAMTLKRLESKRIVAIQRLSRLITAIWPRAQLVSYVSLGWIPCLSACLIFTSKGSCHLFPTGITRDKS